MRSFNATPPENIRVPKNKKSLFLRWPFEEEIEIAANILRDHCQSASALSHELRGLSVPAAEKTAITKIEPVGSYAINIVFSDGEERGIYPWALLREIAVKMDKAAKAGTLA